MSPKFVRLPTGVVIHDVGPDLNACFDSLYASGVLSPNFPTAAFAYFDRTPNPDPFAFNFGQAALPRPHTSVAGLALWEWVLELLHSWESANPGRRLHKGGAYYFAAIRDIVVGNLERGFLYMHQAAAEDRMTYGSGRTPSIAFVTLDARMQDQAFKSRVETYSAYLRDRLRSYRAHRSGSLTLPELRRRFERHPELEEALFVLAATVARLTQSNTAAMRRVRHGQFARVTLARTVLDLALVVEQMLLVRFGASVKRPPTFVPLAVAYADAVGLGVASYLPTISSTFRTAGFDRTMRHLLAGVMPPKVTGSFAPREFDLAVVAGLRNHSAHGVVRSELVGRRFDELVRRTFYVLFSVIEDCYP